MTCSCVVSPTFFHVNHNVFPLLIFLFLLKFALQVKKLRHKEINLPKITWNSGVRVSLQVSFPLKQ